MILLLVPLNVKGSRIVLLHVKKSATVLQVVTRYLLLTYDAQTPSGHHLKTRKHQELPYTGKAQITN